MDTITTTNLRTQSSKLVDTLKKGGTVSLIHRSKVVGVIKPKQKEKIFTKEDALELKKIAKSLNLPALSYNEREKRYCKAMLKKHGKNIS